jgi:multidrug efflux pump subunit AcrA (membrane-fusion protein)
MYKTIIYISALLAVGAFACKGKKQAEEEDQPPATTQTPVTVTSISTEQLADSVVLNATASFVQSNVVKSNINGYIEAVHTRIGEYAGAGKELFTLKTKEAKSLGNTVNNLDPSFHFSGVIHIKAPQGGYITQLLHQAGDYVQDGEQLAVLSDSKGFGFILNVPYELRRYINVNKAVLVTLPDGTKLNGTVASIMPTIDSVSQTQTVLVKTPTSIPIPQNLIAKVSVPKNLRNNAPTLPKSAILTDESQSAFWVMKLIDSVTAVKVPIIKGLETADRVEILRPVFGPNDRVVLTGNYGLADTAKVKIVKAAE